MKTMYRLSVVVLILTLTACGAENDKAKQLAEKKAELKKLQTEQQDITKKIDSLEAQIGRLDTSAAKAEKARLVAVSPLSSGRFTHYIDLKGIVDAENVAYVSPRGQGGQVKAIYVKQGDVVRKGQLLIRLDDLLTVQQIEQVKIQLSLAQTLYDRRKNLWEQKIGTEVELLQAKNNVENLQKQIELLKETQSMSNVYAEMNGVADQVNIKVGEFFTPQTAQMSGIRIVNTNDLKVKADVPENYLGKVTVGSNVLVTLPEAGNDTIRTQIKVAGKIIDPTSRTFYIEAKIPAGKNLRPNQLAMVRIQDYTAGDAISIPVSTLQSDEKGKFVLVAVKEKDRLIAKKKAVTVGELNGNRLEIKTGLSAGDELITEGFQGLYDGQLITTDVK